MSERGEPKDPRSTGRKRGRAALERQGRPYWCRSTLDGGFISEMIGGKKAGCGRSPTDENAPGGHYPGMATLQVNHINKNILDNDPVNLEWVCPACHKVIDSQTEVGVSIKGDEWGYGLVVGGSLPPSDLGIPGVTVVPDES